MPDCRWLFQSAGLIAVAGLLGCSRSDSGSVAVSKSAPNRPAVKQSPFRFQTPVRLMADGAPIEVEAPGFAFPSVADVDGDGAEDLVVGQFSSGAMKLYRNIALVDQMPELAGGEWIQSEDKKAVVPGVW